MNIIAQDVIDLHLFFSIIIGYELRTTANHIERMKRKTVTFVARSLWVCVCVRISLCIHNSQLCICAYMRSHFRIHNKTQIRVQYRTNTQIICTDINTSVIQNIRRNAHTHRKEHLVLLITVTIMRDTIHDICVLLMWKRVVFCVRYQWHQAHNRIRRTGQTRTEWFKYLQICTSNTLNLNIFPNKMKAK